MVEKLPRGDFVRKNTFLSPYAYFFSSTICNMIEQDVHVRTNRVAG